MDQPKYHIDIFWSGEDGGYVANVPDLRYCSAFGETYEEALGEVLESMRLHLDALQEFDRPVPEPGSRRRTAINAVVLESGQTVQITEEAGGGVAAVEIAGGEDSQSVADVQSTAEEVTVQRRDPGTDAVQSTTDTVGEESSA